MGYAIPTPAQYAAMYRPLFALIDSVGDAVDVIVRQTDGSFAAPIPAKAKVSSYAMAELIGGAPAKQGDFRAIIRATPELAAIGRRLEVRDRIKWKGREYAVQNWDDATHAVGGEVMAYEAQLRG